MRGRAFLVHHLLEAQAERRPEHTLLVHESEPTSYGDVEAGANRLARLLRREGLQRGDRVGLVAENGRFYVEAYYGILKAGGVAVPLNSASRGAALARVLAHCEATVLLAGTRRLRVASAALAAGAGVRLLGVEGAKAPPETGVATVPLGEALASESRERPPARGVDLDVASIVFTSGSTGTPQGATLTHLNLVSNTRSIVEYLELGGDDRVLCVLPFHYVYGKSLLNTHVAVGGSVAIENRFLYPNVALDTLEAERCTGFSGVPSTFAILLDRSNLAQRRLAHLRYVTQAGGPMSPALTRRLMAALPRQRIFVMYGATEASARLAYLAPDLLPRKIGSIGKAIPNVELRLLRPDGSEAEVDEEGEIVARGSNIMQGYWNDPESTSRVLDANGYHTGDLARRDAEGFLYVVGRKSDFVKVGAHRVSAKEVEEAILEEPGVHEAAVVGEPDATLGERLKAFVVWREGGAGDPQVLRKALRRRLAPYKVPAEIATVANLPKTESGKVLKRELLAGDEA